jgi:hypothetical protein
MIPPRPRASSCGRSPRVARRSRLHVQAHERPLALRRGRGEGTVARDAGVVDEQLELELGGAREQRLDSGGGREIGDERLDAPTACVDVVGECALRSGVDSAQVSRFAGHSKVSTTLDLYVGEEKRRVNDSGTRLAAISAADAQRTRRMPVALRLPHRATPSNLGDGRSWLPAEGT